MEFTLRQTRLKENLAAVRERIGRAAASSGRTMDDVQLIAVTKYVDAAISRDLVIAGCTDLGESRPQQLWFKADELEGVDCQWHMIGHLQRNKVERTIRLTSLVHSVDSERLIAMINTQAERLGTLVDVLLEVNTSGEVEKHGLTADEVMPFLACSDQWPHVRVRGLMTMAARGAVGSAARSCFAELRQLRDRLAGKCPANVSLQELSMGMSGDFEEAILEGATLVRIGSALFEGVE
ncbi:MAG: YggS family pyridoxal phosphate-dependent enzyme [Pirellulales bacterium]|nr:YggS family pyridoxal phosphate-dependent enzyme [Pirellulales bacterium]